MTALSGRCMCGATTWTATTQIIWAAICHCEDCRKAASCDHVSWFGLERRAVNWKGPRKCFKSSELVVRSFCQDCGSPMSFETEIFESETHLYAATLNDRTSYKPSAHIYWSERLPWIEISDSLPKHSKGLQHAAKNDQEISRRKSKP